MQAWKQWSLGLCLWVMLGAGCGGAISFGEDSAVQGLSSCTEGSCNTGYVCVDGACKMGCREKSDCGEGDLVCEGAVQGTLGWCVKVREVPPGQSRCDESTCPHGYCEANVCKPGCRLNDDSTCADKHHICVPTKEASGNGLGVCELGCREDNPEKNCGTHSGYVCVVETGTAGKCKPGCKDDGNCPAEEGHQICVGYKNTPAETLGFCQPGCRVDDNATCIAGYVCIGYGGNTQPGTPGICRLGCTFGSTPSGCGNGYHCVRNDPSNSNSPAICLRTCYARERDSECGVGEICENQNIVGNPIVCRPGCRVGNIYPNSCLPEQLCVSAKMASRTSWGRCQGGE